MAADFEIHALVLYRKEVIEVVIEDIFDDPRSPYKRLNVRSLEGKPFHEWNVQISDPKFGGGHGWYSRSPWHSISILQVQDVWIVKNGKVTEHWGMPPATKKYHEMTNKV